MKENKKKIIRIAVIVVSVVVVYVVANVFIRKYIKNQNYNAAVESMNDEDYREAMKAFYDLGDYKDASQNYLACENKLLSEAEVGDTIFFGTYSQKKKKVIDPEPIEWIIVEKTDDQIFVVSKYGLEWKKYSEMDSCNWERSDVRAWLNDTFLEQAFLPVEQERIIEATVSADPNPQYNIDPGNSTQDKIFLLSIDEAVKYFPTDAERVCIPTTYAVGNGVYIASWTEGHCIWMLRSPGGDNDYVADVNILGEIDYFGGAAGAYNKAVRPAMRIQLSKD